MSKSLHPKSNSRRLSRSIKLMLMLALSLSVIARTAVQFTNAQSLPPDAQITCPVTSSAFANWFETGAVSLNGVVKPADSITFPNNPNCSFYQWSWQMFLWLTSPAPVRYGGGGGRIFSSGAFYDVSPPDSNGDRTFIPHVSGGNPFIPVFNIRSAQRGPSGLPVVMTKQGRLFEVQPPRIAPNGKQLITNSAGKSVELERVTLGPNRRLSFLDKDGKAIQLTAPTATARVQFSKAPTLQKFIVGGIPVFADPFGNVIDTEEGQAGGGDTLMAQNGSLVYYTTTVNDVYAYFLTGTKNGGIIPAPTQFPTTPADLNKIIAFAATKGKTFIDPDALAIEIKSAWVEAAGLSNLSSYITMQATIPTYNKTDPNHWVPNGKKTTQLALVGMHVVGSAAGHPEMIWATFEHFGNTPNATYAYNSTTGPKTVTQNTAGTWLFCANGSAGPFNQTHMTAAGAEIFSVTPFNISASNTIRWKAFGGASDFSPNPLDPTAAASNTEIISINNSVLGKLAGGDIRGNYYMTGSTWTIGGAAPTGSFKGGGGGGNEVGTSLLANTTMETYQQGSNTLWATGTNCFSCHHSNTTNVSHIFAPLKPLF